MLVIKGLRSDENLTVLKFSPTWNAMRSCLLKDHDKYGQDSEVSFYFLWVWFVGCQAAVESKFKPEQSDDWIPWNYYCSVAQTADCIILKDRLSDYDTLDYYLCWRCEICL